MLRDRGDSDKITILHKLDIDKHLKVKQQDRQDFNFRYITHSNFIRTLVTVISCNIFEFVFYLKFKSWMDSIRQRVYLAAELLSRTVANALDSMYPNDTNMTNLSKFIRLIDLWFDVFNRLVFVAFHFSNLHHNSNISWKCQTSKKDIKDNLPYHLHSNIFYLKWLYA